MPKFTEGDWVIITKPADTTEWPTWNPDMNRYDRVTGRIAQVDDHDEETLQYRLDICNWWFGENWLSEFRPTLGMNLQVNDNFMFPANDVIKPYISRVGVVIDTDTSLKYKRIYKLKFDNADVMWIPPYYLSIPKLKLNVCMADRVPKDAWHDPEHPINQYGRYEA